MKLGLQEGRVKEISFRLKRQTGHHRHTALAPRRGPYPEYRKSEKYRKIIASNLGGAYLSVLK
ncbi:MAG TPA: hypothetical protein VKQ08_09020 [Cyclobacteriaceae bacterium]|nr:hypothetical protein [Cyclobacteriaceae bacterium]